MELLFDLNADNECCINYVVEHEPVFVKALVVSLNSFMWLFIGLYFDLRSKTKVDAVNEITGSPHH